MSRDHLPFPLPQREPAMQVREADTATLRSQAGKRTMPMRGFDARYRDIVHYIVEITEEIWGDRDIGRIHDTYAAECVVYKSDMTVRGADAVVASTLQSLSAQPDWDTRHLSVTWSGNEEDFYTSHLGFARSTNRGPSAFGPPTNRRYGIRFIADCVSRENRIHTEWLARDNLSLVRQLGFDPHDAARLVAERSPPVPPEFVRAAQHWEAAEGSWDGFWARHFGRCWNQRHFDQVASSYAPDAAIHWPGGEEARGPRGIGQLLIGLFASLPDAQVTIEHKSWSEETDGVVVAVRWQLEGSSRAGGWLGAIPEGRAISLIGMSHFRFSGPLIVEEWTVFDAMAALAQAYAA